MPDIFAEKAFSRQAPITTWIEKGSSRFTDECLQQCPCHNSSWTRRDCNRPSVVLNSLILWYLARQRARRAGRGSWRFKSRQKASSEIARAGVHSGDGGYFCRKASDRLRRQPPSRLPRLVLPVFGRGTVQDHGVIDDLLTRPDIDVITAGHPRVFDALDMLPPLPVDVPLMSDF